MRFTCHGDYRGTTAMEGEKVNWRPAGTAEGNLMA